MRFLCHHWIWLCWAWWMSISVLYRRYCIRANSDKINILLINSLIFVFFYYAQPNNSWSEQSWLTLSSFFRLLAKPLLLCDLHLNILNLKVCFLDNVLTACGDVERFLFQMIYSSHNIQKNSDSIAVIVTYYVVNHLLLC